MKTDKNITKNFEMPVFGENPGFNWDAPDIFSRNSLSISYEENIKYRLFRITEVGKEKAGAYRLAMANVLSILNGSDVSVVYILSGHREGVEIYMGVADVNTTNIAEPGDLLKGALEGNFPGVKLTPVPQDDLRLQECIKNTKHLGCVMGVPSFNEATQDAEQEDFQGVERLVNSLNGETWQLVLVAKPAKDQEIRTILQYLYELSTELSVHAKQSVQESENHGDQRNYTAGQQTGSSVSKGETDGITKTEGSSTNESRSESKGTSHAEGTSSNEGGSSSSKGKSTTKSTTDNINDTKGTGTSNSDAISKNTSKTESWNKGENFSASYGTTDSRGIALTRERINKPIEEMQKHISETVIERFQLGRSKGMFSTAVYLTAENKLTYQRLSQGFLSLFQGNKAAVTPLRIHKIQGEAVSLRKLLQIRSYTGGEWLVKNLPSFLAHGIPFNNSFEYASGACWLNTSELCLLTGLPNRELPGIKLRKSVDFAVNTSEDISDNNGKKLELGHMVQYGRELKNTVKLPVRDLNKHVFITGVTGSGKTTSCMKLLLESGLPFLVLEPAKTEYRAFFAQGYEDVEYYIPGREDITPFRLNPFELVSSRQNLSGHISTLTATLTAVYPMEAAMPQLVEEAIILAYRKLGWDIQGNRNYLERDPWSKSAAGRVWPTFTDMLGELDGLIQSKGMGREFEEKYRGSLVARLSNLTEGIKGRMLNTRRSMNFDALLDRRVVIELEELKSEQDKALFMGLIISRLGECMKQRHREQPDFQHLTLVEEAHRLLARPEPGESDAKKMGVEMFANLLSEVRKYGEGLIIADQIPNKLISDVIKNTHTKIVHRLFAADDRNSMGDAMGLTDDQKDFLPHLQTGETIMYCGGWHAPVRVQIIPGPSTDEADLPEERLKEKGWQLFWEQGNLMLPQVMDSKAIENSENLSVFMPEGVALLNLFLQMLKEKARDLITILEQRYNEDFHNLKDKLNFSEEKLAELLICLLWDSACIPMSFAMDDLFRKKSPELLIEGLKGRKAISEKSALKEIEDSYRDHIPFI
ncbi:ATP-binding protein [Desulfobotulus mexicanus]|nr:DUF87 domain-containing protein [Desulfobotulus mexicanus]